VTNQFFAHFKLTFYHLHYCISQHLSWKSLAARYGSLNWLMKFFLQSDRQMIILLANNSKLLLLSFFECILGKDHLLYIDFYSNKFAKSFSLIADYILDFACRNNFHANYVHWLFMTRQKNWFFTQSKCQKISPINQEVLVQLFKLWFFIVLQISIQITEYDFVVIKVYDYFHESHCFKRWILF
jgi:hypothetical protein